jgi:hypothetical protein
LAGFSSGLIPGSLTKHRSRLMPDSFRLKADHD